jgi:two-component system, NtrC family, C4-dicarboxylate transport response regulator DctD
MNKLIVVLDDEKRLLEVISEILVDGGYQVKTFPEAKQLIKELPELSNSNLSLILSDIQLPTIGGLELLSSLKMSAWSHVPVIFMTGFVKIETLQAAIQLGAADFLNKPIESNELLNRVCRVIEAADTEKKALERIKHIDPSAEKLIRISEMIRVRNYREAKRQKAS